MLPPRDFEVLPSSAAVRARFDPATMTPDQRHCGFGLRLRGWLSRLWRPAAPRRQGTGEAAPSPLQTVEGETRAATSPGAHAAIVQDGAASAVAEGPVLARARRTLRLDPARDDNDWRWPDSAGGG